MAEATDNKHETDTEGDQTQFMSDREKKIRDIREEVERQLALREEGMWEEVDRRVAVREEGLWEEVERRVEGRVAAAIEALKSPPAFVVAAKPSEQVVLESVKEQEHQRSVRLAQILALEDSDERFNQLKEMQRELNETELTSVSCRVLATVLPLEDRVMLADDNPKRMQTELNEQRFCNIHKDPLGGPEEGVLRVTTDSLKGRMGS